MQKNETEEMHCGKAWMSSVPHCMSLQERKGEKHCDMMIEDLMPNLVVN